MQDYKSFVVSLKRSLYKLVRESNLTCSEFADAAGVKEDRLISLVQGTANIHIDDILNIARAAGMRAEFHLFDTISGEEYGFEGSAYWFYADCSDENMTLRRRELLRAIIASADDSQRNQLSHELESLAKPECNNSRLRYFIFLKVEEAMHSLCLSRSELADMMNVSQAYINRLADGDADFSIEFLYRISSILSSSWNIRFVPWKEGLEEKRA